jgi:hypothetical protein
MGWNPFGGERMPKKKLPEESGEGVFAEQAKEAGFDLDFVFTVQTGEEELVAELRDIQIQTFWADNPMDGKVADADLPPQHHQLLARKEEILADTTLQTYLQPYATSVEAWRQKAVEQRALDRALDHWTAKYGDAHRQRFLAAMALFRN